MRTFLCFFLLLAELYLYAQRECATSDYLQQIERQNTVVAKQFRVVEQFFQQQQSNFNNQRIGTTAYKIIRIPVVVHILYNTASQNISDEQVMSGIAALNRDFRKQNADTVQTPPYFKNLAADIEIEFALATVDPWGRATTGIVRKKTNTTDWGMDDKIKFSAQGGDDAWDSRSYLNIWVGPMRKLLGFSSSPGSPLDKDGIVINTSAFGTINTTAPYDLGRTTVHEAGHWLGLKHIWGDTNCGDDGIGDTPVQAGFTSGCPTSIRNTCGNTSTGDMYMNFMDFTNDACLNLFTLDQKERMRACFISDGPRYSLLFSNGLGIPSDEAVLPGEEAATSTSIKIYPNPIQNEVTLQLGSEADWMGSQMKIMNMHGVMVYHGIINSVTQSISLNHLPAGVYFLVIENGKKKINQKLVKL